MGYCFRSSIRYIYVNREFTLLDVRADRYYLLNEDESSELTSIFHGSMHHEEAITKFEKCGIIELAPQKPQIIESCQHPGIGNHDWSIVGTFRKHPYRITDYYLSLWHLILVKLLLIFGGLQGLLKKIEKANRKVNFRDPNSTNPPNIPPFSTKSIESIASAVYDAGLILPFRSKCLESSAALKLILLGMGVNSHLVIGIQRYDFLAHAWVTVNGRVVGDRLDLEDRMSVIARF